MPYTFMLPQTHS